MPKKTHFRRTKIQRGLALLGLALPWLHAQAAPQIEIGNNSIHIIKDDGSLWSWGENYNGQTGVASPNDKIQSPQLIAGNWKQVGAVGGLAIKADGTLWRISDTGSSDDPVLQALTRQPQQVGEDNDWAQVSQSYDAVLLKQDGSLWLYTRDPNDPLSEFKIEPLDVGAEPWLAVKADAHRLWAIRADHSLWYWQRDYLNGPLPYARHQWGTDTDWESFGGESDTIRIVKSDKSTWENVAKDAWFYSSVKIEQKYDSSWLAVDSHIRYFVGIKQDHTLWQWGEIVEPSGFRDYVQRTIEQPEQVGSDSNWESVSAGDHFAIASKSDGSLWGWGLEGSSSFLGVDYWIPRQVSQETDWWKTRTGGYGSFAIKVDGTLWSWGYSEQLGLSNSTTDEWGYIQTPDVWHPQQVGGDRDWVDISAGWRHIVALKANGSIWSWGGNRYGVLGLGIESTSFGLDSPAQIGDRTDWVKIAAAEDTSYAIDNSGRLWAWGENSEAQIGDGTEEDRIVPTQVGNDTDWRDITGGWGHALAIKADGSLWGWGRNSQGQLGDGTTEDHPTPVRIGSDNDWKTVVAGDSHNIALKADGSIWGWGFNYSGQAGLGHNNPALQPSRIGTDSDWIEVGADDDGSFAIKSDNSLWVWGKGEALGLGGLVYNHNAPVKMSTPATWFAIGFGADSRHKTAIRCDGTLWAWGRRFSALGQEYNNVITEPTPIFIPAQLPDYSVSDASRCLLSGSENIDLQVASASVTTTGSINAGSNLDAEFSISNLGSIGTSSEPFVAQWYLSADNQIDTNDIALNSVLLTGMNSGETLAYSSQVNIPITTQATSYFLILLIDATNTQTESDESNNSFNLGQITVARPNGRPEQPPGKIRRKQ
ncbi:RCC1 domain-containing protein [Shewanella cyperi]|uniref:RCC1 domain-containing protein n=1 Tax=Shewanella cyperi TaxID=2814292 RepID=UPI001A9531B3|nr:CARDB domain-containing protein [Shewanella cyperi]QSX41284.1 hypothetical protein JYB84_02280 [Shewanella cyperi]